VSVVGVLGLLWLVWVLGDGVGYCSCLRSCWAICSIVCSGVLGVWCGCCWVLGLLFVGVGVCLMWVMGCDPSCLGVGGCEVFGGVVFEGVFVGVGGLGCFGWCGL